MIHTKIQRQPIEKSPAPLCGFGPKSIHGWNKPYHWKNFAEGQLRYCLSVQLDGSRTTLSAACHHRVAGIIHDEACRYLPTDLIRLQSDLFRARPSQSSSRGQKTNRFENIGLAYAVWPDKHDGPRIDFDPQPLV